MKRFTVLAVILPLLFLSSELVSQKSDPDALLAAVIDGDIAKARALIAAGTSADTLIPKMNRDQRETILMEAALRGKVDLVSLLLESGAKIDAVDSRGMNALSYAVSKPEGAEAARVLVEKGAKADAPIVDYRGAKTTVLKAAAVNGMLAVVDLLAPGAGDAGKKQLAEAMRWVGAQGKVELVEALLSRGVEPIWDDLDRSDSMARAAAAGYLDVVIAMMKRGARADTPDANATTPLMTAAARGRLEILRYLLDKGARALAGDATGKKALSYLNGYYYDENNDPTIPAVTEQQSARFEVMRDLLVKAGAPFDLFYAIRAGDLANAKKLVNAGNANSRDGSDSRSRTYWSNDQWAISQGKQAGPSPLFLAVETGRLDIAKAMAEKGASIDDPCVFCGKYDFYSMTPLEMAIYLHKEDLVAFLLGKGAKPNDEMLADASGYQSLGIVKLLVEKGANVNASWGGESSFVPEDAEGGYNRVGDVLSAAVQSGPSPVVDYLRKKGAKLSGHVLASAVIAGNAALVRECLAAGFEANESLLVAACSFPDIAIARDLVKSGVDANGKDYMGRRPLTVAAEHENFALVKFLVENGADVGVTSGREGGTALEIVKDKTGKEAKKIADFLWYIPPGPGGYRIQKELSQALLKKDSAPLKRLLDAKADPNMRFMPPEGSDLSSYPPSLLDVACVLESKEMIQLLLSKGACLDDTDKGLYFIAADGRLDLVELLLSTKTKKPDEFTGRMSKMLCIAAKTGNLKLASLALAKGADPNDDYAGNALQIAIERDSVAVAVLLLERGALVRRDKGISDNMASRLFERFLKTGRFDAAKFLLSRCAKDSGYLPSGLTYLSSAIRSGDKAAFDWLLKNGVNPGFPEKSGDAPLHAAVDSGDMYFVRTLAEQNISLDALDARGETASMRAASLPGRGVFLSVLLKKGARAGLSGGKSFSLVDAVMAYGSWDDEILGLLSESYAALPSTDPGADARQRFFLALMKRDYAQASTILDSAKGVLDAAVFEGRTALMGCSAHGDLEGLKYLLDKGANASIRDESGLTALGAAARSGKREAVDALLSRLPDSPDQREEALRQAAFAGDTGLVRAFLDAGTNPDGVQGDGPSALFLAAWQGRTETVDFLLKAASAKGAKIDMNRRCRTAGRWSFKEALAPAEAALAGGQADIAASLMAKGASVDWLRTASQIREEARGGLFRFFASKANAESRKEGGSELLKMAARNNDVEAVKVILAAGVDPSEAFNQTLSWGDTWDDAEIRSLLAAKTAPDRAYSNALEIAIEKGWTKTVKAFLDAGWDPNGKARGAWWDDSPSLYKLAVFIESPEIMRMLLAKGAKDSLNPPELAFLRYFAK